MVSRCLLSVTLRMNGGKKTSVHPIHILLYLFYTAAVDVSFFSYSYFFFRTAATKVDRKRHSRLTANRFICRYICSSYCGRNETRRDEKKTKRSRAIFKNLLVLITFFLSCIYHIHHIILYTNRNLLVAVSIFPRSRQYFICG